MSGATFFTAAEAAERAVHAGASALLQWQKSHPEHEITWEACLSQARDVLQAAADSYPMPSQLGDEGWDVLATKADDAGYDRKRVHQRRRRDDFTTAVIETSYQHGYRELLRRLGGREWKNR